MAAEEFLGLLDNRPAGVPELAFDEIEDGRSILDLIEKLVKGVYRLADGDVTALPLGVAMPFVGGLLDPEDLADNPPGQIGPGLGDPG